VPKTNHLVNPPPLAENNLIKQSSIEDFSCETGVETPGGTDEHAMDLGLKPSVTVKSICRVLYYIDYFNFNRFLGSGTPYSCACYVLLNKPAPGTSVSKIPSLIFQYNDT